MIGTKQVQKKVETSTVGDMICNIGGQAKYQGSSGRFENGKAISPREMMWICAAEGHWLSDEQKFRMAHRWLVLHILQSKH